jgi:hypothetical protein
LTHFSTVMPQLWQNLAGSPKGPARRANGIGRATFNFELRQKGFYSSAVTVDTFKHEMTEALKAYDRYVVCIDKVPEDAEASLQSLMEKAIKAYENRGPHLRHGIALDRQITIILSQTDGERPLCGIYFNLHSPYQKKTSSKTVKSAS